MNRIMNRIMNTKYLLLVLGLISSLSLAQQLSYPLPRDARDNVLYFGVGNPFAFTLTATSDAYDTAVRYEVPTNGLNAKRVFRHLYILNPSATRTAFVCFGDATGCTVDSFIVRPGYGLVFEPILFGSLHNTGYVYVRLDAAGSQVLDLSIW